MFIPLGDPIWKQFQTLKAASNFGNWGYCFICPTNYLLSIYIPIMVLSADDTALNKTEEDNLCISGVYRELVSHYSKRKKDGGQCPEYGAPVCKSRRNSF